jgi:glycosyltransferase involved in cell wall biosynthesis
MPNIKNPPNSFSKSTRAKMEIAIKPSVFMLVPSFHPLPMGGSEKQAALLSRRLVSAGKAEITVVTVGDNLLPKFEIFEGIRIFRVFSLKKRSKKVQVARAIRIEGFADTEKIFGKKPRFKELADACVLFMKTFPVFYARRKEYALIHVHTVELIAFVALLIALLLNKKVLVKDSTMNGLIKVGMLPIFGKRIQKLIARHGYFIAMTKKIEENYLLAGVKKERIFRIANGVEVPSESHFKAENDNIATFVGNLYQQPAKGVDILLKAWVHVVAVRPQAILRVVGKGDIEAYQAFVQRLAIEKNVQLLGSISNVESLLLQTDIFILPSRREGMSNALMEAMALGIPCIATKISGSEDLIVDRESGILVEPENISALAEGILYLLHNHETAKEMGKKARNRIIEMCLVETIADKYYQAYKTILHH